MRDSPIVRDSQHTHTYMGLGVVVAVQSFAWLLHLVPLRAVAPLGRALGRIVHALRPWRLRVLQSNLHLAAPVLPMRPRELVRAAYEHLGHALLLTLLPVSRWRGLRTEVLDATALHAFVADCAAGGVLVCSAHIGVWELLPAVLSSYTPDTARRHGWLVYRPLHNRLLDGWLRRRRTRAACMALVQSSGSLGTLRDALGIGGLVGLLPDQRPSANGASVSAVLLGQPSEFSPGLGLLHAYTHAPVWFAALMADPASPTTVRLHLQRLAARGPAACPSGSDSSALLVAAADDTGQVQATTTALMQTYADAVSTLVRSAPSQYLWFHRRWRIPLS